LADTGSIQHDELYKKSITELITKHIDSITAVLVLANGTVPRSTMLSTLSAVFRKPLTNNVAFMFTNISSPLSLNFCQDTIPATFKGSPQLHIDNPICLQKRYLWLKDDQGMKHMRAGMREEVRAAEQGALNVLVDLFEWADGLDPLPTMRAVHHHEESHNIGVNVIASLTAQMKQLWRKVKRKMQEGLRKIRQIFIREQKQVRPPLPV